MATQYNHSAIEKKWRENWEEKPINVNRWQEGKVLLSGYVPIPLKAAAFT